VRKVVYCPPVQQVSCKTVKRVIYLPAPVRELTYKPLKTECCYDSFREPYRISYPRLCPDRGETVEIGNTPAALAMRQRAIVRQREIVEFEKGMIAASTPITQPSSTGTTIFGETEGAGVFDNGCAPIPPRYTGEPVVASRVVRLKPAIVGEYVPTGRVLIAVPVPGKAGYVYSPFNREAGYVDVSGLAPGSLAKDPYCGRTFRVP